VTDPNAERAAEALVSLFWLGLAVRAALAGDVGGTALFLFGIWWIAGVRMWRHHKQRRQQWPGPS